MAATGGHWDDLLLVYERFPCIPRWMDAGARWNTPLQTLYFVLSIGCLVHNIQCSSNFRLEHCLVQNTELFSAHQIFIRKIFVGLIYLQKFFATKIWSYTVYHIRWKFGIEFILAVCKLQKSAKLNTAKFFFYIAQYM